MISVEIFVASMTLCKLVEYIDRLFLPVLDIASKMQVNYGNIFLNKDKKKCSSMWNTNACISASTKYFHT